MPMTIGEYSLSYYPSGFTIPRPDRANAYVETLTSVAHFSWGFFLVGKVIELRWNFMPAEQFDALDAIFQQDEEVVWYPGEETGLPSYDVQILNFDGDYHESVQPGPETWRSNCRMTLLIMSEV